jgi:putative ABC transport system permease protein
MLKNYIKIAFRNMKRYKGFSFINIFGLAIGLSCSFLVFAYVFDELSYDRFHQDADRIYRIIINVKTKDSEDRGLLTSYILAKTLRENYPEKLQVSQVKLRESIVTINSKSFGNERIIGADSSFFDVFTYQFVIGNPKTALNSPNEVIITDEAAIKYFGNAKAMGQTIQLNGNPYKITGIIKNNHQNSHFYFDGVFSLKSLSNYGDTRFLYCYYSTYVKLPLSVHAYRLKNILAEYDENNLGTLLAKSDLKISHSIEPLLGIHLRSDLNGPYGANSKIEYVYIFSVIAILILIIACINYVNLTNAKNLNRGREVGIRKVVGSMRMQIIKQFLLESVVFCWIAVGIALILVKIYLPFFNNFLGKVLQLNYLSNPLTIIGFILFATIIGIMAGIYPALYLSSFEPIKVLKDSRRGGQKKFRLQSSLVVFQYAISVIFIISTFVISEQLELVQKRNLGFDKEQVIVLHGGETLGRQKEVFKNNLLKHPEIINVTGTSSLPGRDFSSWSSTPEDVESSLLAIYFCDHNFAETMGVDMQSGRFFSKEFPSDERAIVINENAVEQFGWTENPVGKKIQLNVHGDYTIIGVVKNFYYESLHNKLGKMGMLLTEGRYYGMEKYLAIRYSSQNIADVISKIKKEWNSIIPNAPFEYSFLDEDYYRLYKSEQQTQKITLLFSFLAILISALGMYGLASFTAERRTKEIGIRKVLGASSSNVLMLMSKDFTKWVILANVFAWPLAYIVMSRWLQNFVYRVRIEPWTFLLSAAIALIVAILTVSYQSIKSAVANPVESLRYE